MQDTEDIWSDIIYINFEIMQSFILTNLYTESMKRCLRMLSLSLFTYGFLLGISQILFLFYFSGFPASISDMGAQTLKGGQ